MQTNKKQRVFVYTGPGTSKELNPCLLNFYKQTHPVIEVNEKNVTLKSILPEDTHITPGAEAGSSDDTIKKGDLLAIGGGNARTIVKDYTIRHGNSSAFSNDLSNIINKGVHYSGICAGAIVACSHFSLLVDKDSLSSSSHTYPAPYTLGMINTTAGCHYHTDAAEDLNSSGRNRLLCEVQSFYSYTTEPYSKVHAFFYGSEPQPRKMDLLTLQTPAFFKNTENDTSIKILASFNRKKTSDFKQPYNAKRQHPEHPMGIFTKPKTSDSPAVFASAPHYEAGPSFFAQLKNHSTGMAEKIKPLERSYKGNQEYIRQLQKEAGALDFTECQ